VASLEDEMDRVLGDIRIRDNTLALQGEKQLKKQIKEEEYHRAEPRYGAFWRSITL